MCSEHVRVRFGCSVSMIQNCSVRFGSVETGFGRSLLVIVVVYSPSFFLPSGFWRANKNMRKLQERNDVLLYDGIFFNPYRSIYGFEPDLRQPGVAAKRIESSTLNVQKPCIINIIVLCSRFLLWFCQVVD